jgi:hypothetical protein
MTGFMRWWYHARDGTPVFVHYRVDDRWEGRGKRYGYKYPTAIVDNRVQGWVYRKHSLADSLVYGLHRVADNPDELLVLTEGERCAVAALRLGVLASTHHGGAGKFTEAQAESLAGHRGRFLLVPDNDPAGAYDVCCRYDLLRAVGIPAKRLRVREVAPTHPGADLRDHLHAGYTLDDLTPADLDRLREVAAAATGHYSEGSWPWTADPGWVEQWKSNTRRNSGM